jgi:tetratricopeptide (TPR) repeat protein
MSPNPRVLCAKCGAQGQGSTCRACGGQLVKLCSQCEFANSPSKNFCDACGTDLSVQASAPAPQGPAAGTTLPQAGRARSIAENAPIPEPEKPKSEVKYYSNEESKVLKALKAAFWTTARAVHHALVFLIMAGAAAAVVFAGLHALRVTRPTHIVLKLGQKYLDALRTNDYATAYGMLSEESKNTCTMDEFRLLRSTAAWTWSGLKVALAEKDLVVLEYDLEVEGRAPILDTLSFVKEDGEWVRPYNWHWIKAAEDSFARNDPDMALIKAGDAVRIDPRDPMARGYLCESVYYRKLPARAAIECRIALELAAHIPSKLSERSLYHLHDILADTYMTTGQPELAAAQFAQMLAFPDLSTDDRCALLGNRADALAAAGKLAEANEDMQRARNECPPPELPQPGRKRPQPLVPSR